MHPIEFRIHLADGGPVYYESHFDHYIVEPWNMASAAIFVLLALYWIRRTWGMRRKQAFVHYGSWLLLIGALGGTIYHGFRVSRLALFMDWVPISVLCLGAATYFLYRLWQSGWRAIAAVAAFFAVEALVYALVPQRLATSLSYIGSALVVLLPTFLLLRKHRFKNAHLIALAVAAFAVAITARIYDRDGLLPMGTHFLWHLFGALATGAMFLFVYRLDSRSTARDTDALSTSKRAA